MCEPASFVVMKENKSYRLFWSKTSDSHEDIISEFNLNDTNVRNEITLVRVEITPEGKDFRVPLEDWEFKTDQDLLPDWYNEKKVEKAVRKELLNWLKCKVVLLGEVRKEVSKNEQVIAVYGTVQNVYGTVQHVYGAVQHVYGTVQDVYSGGTVQCVYSGGTVQHVHGAVQHVYGTVQDVYSGGTVQCVYSGGTVQHVHGAVQCVYSGGTVQHVYGTVQYVYGTVQYVRSGTVQHVCSGGTVQYVHSGGAVQNVYLGGTVQNVHSGTVQHVCSGGTVQYVHSGGTVITHIAIPDCKIELGGVIVDRSGDKVVCILE